MNGSQFHNFLLPCYRAMYAAAFAILRDSDDASDAVQDTFASLWLKHEALPVPDNPTGFCIQATRNTCIDRLRICVGKYVQCIDQLMQIPDTTSADAETSLQSTQSYIRHVLERFPDKQRLILTMSFISQLDYAEISRATGESADNIRQIISRGRIRLKEYLSNEA